MKYIFLESMCFHMFIGWIECRLIPSLTDSALNFDKFSLYWNLKFLINAYFVSTSILQIFHVHFTILYKFPIF